MSNNKTSSQIGFRLRTEFRDAVESALPDIKKASYGDVTSVGEAMRWLALRELSRWVETEIPPWKVIEEIVPLSSPGDFERCVMLAGNFGWACVDVGPSGVRFQRTVFSSEELKRERRTFEIVHKLFGRSGED